MNAFYTGYGKRVGLSKDDLLERYREIRENRRGTFKLPRLPEAYVLTYGKNFSKIEMIKKPPKYEYKWRGRRYTKAKQLKFMKEACDFFQTILPRRVIQHITIHPSWVKLFGEFSASCNVLTMGVGADWLTTRDIERIPDISTEDLNKLLNNVTIHKGLALLGPKQIPSDHETVRTIDWLKVNQCQWMTLDQLKALRNQVIMLSDVTISDSDVREFLNQFKKFTGNNKLRVMRLEKYLGENWQIDEVLKGLKARRVKPLQYKVRDVFPWGEDIYLAEFLPPSTTTVIQIREAYAFKRNNRQRVIVEFRGSALNVFVLERPRRRRWC
uniref:FTH domain-containing protein n=1 Tax=Caenorhabditis tropicalis TaxID=1561998 RepID=A0A1I7T1U7_9PELO